MKIFQTSLALVALVALMLLYAHAEVRCHYEVTEVEFCATNHAECHTCSDEPCADTPVVAWVVPVSEIPVPQRSVLYKLKPEPVVFVASPHPTGDLQRLQTVQLLI